jgi:hypothetical protein
MIVGWLSQQLASVENTRMKYSGSDFKFTSQANHMAKLQAMKRDYERRGFHLQRLYKRRKVDENGIMRSTFGSIMDPPETLKKKLPATTPDHDNCVDRDDLNQALKDFMDQLDANDNDIIDMADATSSIVMEEF